MSKWLSTKQAISVFWTECLGQFVGKRFINPVALGLVILVAAFSAVDIVVAGGLNEEEKFDRIPLELSLDMPDLKLKGQLKQGSIIFGMTRPNHQVLLNKNDLKVTAGGLFVMGFNRDAQSDHELVVIDSRGDRSEYPINVLPRSYDIQYIEGIPKKMMQPNTDDLARIRKENAMIRKARATNSDLLSFTEPFIWPAKGTITGVYGSQRYYNGEPRRPHFGLDIAAPEGADVIAPASGTVTLAHPGMFFSGGTIVLDHGHGISSTFIHLSKVLVKRGQAVQQGDRIAEIGQSGRATGPHLDWRINWYGERLDPGFLIGLTD